MPKENAWYKCLSWIILDSVIRVYKRCYTQTLLQECKYKIKMTKMKNLINDDLSDNLIMDQVMMNLMINLLNVKTVF